MPRNTEKSVTNKARRAAESRRNGKIDIAWSEALSEAPFQNETISEPWETTYRKSYATRLVELGVSSPAGRGGPSGKSGESTLERRTFRATSEELAEHDRRAKMAGVPWNTWVRRKLLDP